MYVPLSSARQNKESEKGLFNTKKNTRTYVVNSTRVISLINILLSELPLL
jgi:hypothetical protein